MKTVTVTIEETLVQDFNIEIGDDEDEAVAIDKAIQKYKAGEIVLDRGEVQAKQIAVKWGIVSKSLHPGNDLVPPYGATRESYEAELEDDAAILDGIDSRLWALQYGGDTNA